MKVIWVLLLALLVSGAWIGWRLADPVSRVTTKIFLKRHGWVFLVVFFALTSAIAVISNFSIKVF